MYSLCTESSGQVLSVTNIFFYLSVCLSVCLSIYSKQYKPEMNLQNIYRKFLPTHYRVENPGKCWLKFDALPIVIKEMDKHVYQTFLF